jgi:hypothetical protein
MQHQCPFKLAPRESRSAGASACDFAKSDNWANTTMRMTACALSRALAERRVDSGEWDIERKNPALYKYPATEAP